ncbi:MAG: hypothetical protein M3P51_02540 [Chloroflexota bacterium]|nr:hypothetical protein [Chloroflexota bacterium]
MKVLRATLTTLVLLALMAFPAVAHDGGDGGWMDDAVDKMEGMMGSEVGALGGDPDDAQDGEQVTDDQQEEATVTKTFELTVNGTAPEGEAFAAVFFSIDPDEEELVAGFVGLCGEVVGQEQVGEDLEQLEAELEAEGIEVETVFLPAEEDCVGGGTVFARSVELPVGDEVFFAFGRDDPVVGGPIFFEEGEETLAGDVVMNEAWFTFEAGVADDQQEMPEEMPETGAGGAAGVPVAPLTGLVSVGVLGALGVLRRR